MLGVFCYHSLLFFYSTCFATSTTTTTTTTIATSSSFYVFVVNKTRICLRFGDNNLRAYVFFQ